MSLPPAPKDISTHPKKGSVVSPTNREVKERDVDRNMRLYAVITALRAGKLPSNAQLSQGLKHLLSTTLSPTTPTTPVHRLSPAGKKLVGDCRQIIESLRTVIDEKNADELVQDFISGLQNVETQGLKDNLLDIEVPVPPNPDLATKHLRTLLTLLLSNAEARKLVTDLSLIGRDLIARSAGAAAKHIAPSPEALANVDKPAEGESFVGGGKGKEAEVGIPRTGMRVKQSAEDELGKGARLAGDNGESATAGEMRDMGLEKGREGVRDVLLDAGEQAKKKRGVVDDANASDVTDRLSRGKERANESVESGKRFLSEEYFPKERRDQFVFRCKKVILELQNHEDYQESIKWLIGYVEDYVKQGRTAIAGEGGVARERVGEGAKRSSLNTSLAQLRTILERFANNVSMDVIFDSINALADDARRDEALWTWWSSVGLWMRKVLLQPGYVIDDECTTHAKRLVDLGREFYEGKYREHFEMLFDSVGKWVGGFGDDPVNKQFANDWARLTKDLLFDGEGNLKFKPELWDDIRRVVVPGLIDQVGYIPIPRIEYSDDGLDLVIENLTLQGRNLFPNFMSVDMNNYIRFSPYTTSSSSSHRRGGTQSHADSLLENDGMMNTHRVKIHLEQMQADMRDVTFWYRKKKGIPKMSDSGVADVVVGGRGLSVIIDLVSTPPHERNDNDSTGSLFQTHSINVKLDSLKFAIRDSNHDFLYKTLRPLATGLVKRQIEKAVREAVGVGLGYVDGWLVGVRERMRDVKEGTKEGVMGEGEGGEGRDEVLRDIFARAKNAARTQHDPSSAARAGAGEATNTVKERAASATKTKARTTANADTSRPSTISRASLASSASSPSTMKTKKRPSQFRIVGDKRNSMFVGGPGSVPSAGAGPEWVSKAEERKGVVGLNEGKGWMSDAFQIAG